MAETKTVLKWVGMGCGTLALLTVMGIGACVFFIKGATDAPADRSHEFFAHMRSGQQAQALAMMTPEYQATHPLPNFQQAVALLPPIAMQADSTFSNRSVNNSSATMSGFLTTPQGNVPVTVTLNQRVDVWYITSVMVAGQPLQ
ncbi:MAG: hypothetical protein ACI9KE_001407 [Polyangiales bacterium]|jgi:hypothetical protein